jgi:hypothetical protein
MLIVSGFAQAREATPTPGAIADQYVVRLNTDPAILEANKPFTLTLTVLRADGQTTVDKFDEVHTKLLHLILVTEDLTQFLHVHPDYQGNGVFVLKDLVLPEVANYVVFADFTPTGDHQHYVRNTLTTNGAVAKQAELNISPIEVTAGGLKMTLDLSQGLKAGEETSLKFHATDAQSGESITDLDEYLGAAGHLVIIDPTSQIYIHTHPAGHNMDSMAEMSGMTNMATATPAMAGMDGMTMPMQYGPDLEFMADFPSEGKWAMWLQVQYKGEVLTFPFVVEVVGMAEGTPEAHAHS